MTSFRATIVTIVAIICGCGLRADEFLTLDEGEAAVLVDEDFAADDDADGGKDAVASWTLCRRSRKPEPIVSGGASISAGDTVTATIPAGEKTTGFDLSFRAHGSGRLVVTVTADTPFGEAKPILGGQNVKCRLIAQHRPYRLHTQPVPIGTARCDVEISVEGEAELSELAFIPREKPVPPITDINRSQDTLPEKYVMAREIVVPPGKADLAPYADCVATDTFEARLRAPVDGSLGTNRRGPFRLDFAEAVSIDEIALTLPQSDILVYADCDGDGRFDRPVVEVAGAPAFGTWTDMPEYVWYVEKLEKPLTVKSLLVQTGAWEIRVFGDASQIAKLPPRPALPVRQAIALGARKDGPVPEAKDRLRFGFTLEPWMVGSQDVFAEAEKTGKAPPPVAEWGGWRGMMGSFERYGANFILLFPPSTFVMPKDAPKGKGSYPYPLLWPSAAWYLNQPHDVLRSMMDACRTNGVECFVITRDWSFGDDAADKPKQVILGEEIAERGAAGVPVCVDEQTFGFAAGPRGDNLAYRRRYLEKASATAGLMAQIKEAAIKANPDALTFGGFAGCDNYRRRYDCVSAFDIWGFEGKVDVIGGDGTYYGVAAGDSAPLGTYIPAVETAAYRACTPTRLAMATLNCNWGTKWEDGRLRNPLVYDDYPSTAFKAGPLVAFFNKAAYVNFWRHNFIYGNGGPACAEATATGGRLVKLLSAWGGKDASIPKDVLVLRSRTSEDWWSLAHDGDHGLRELGFSLFFWTAARLCETATPFEVYPMHRPETWRDIAREYKAIVLPFAYAVSDEEAAALKAAAEAGVRIIAPGTYPLGGADGMGEPRAAPALADIPVERFEFEAKPGNSTAALADAFAKKLRFALEARGGPSLSLVRAPDHDVQAYRLDAPDGSALVLVVNWSERDTEADIAVGLPFTDGGLEIATEDGLYDAPFSPALRLSLPREAVRLLRFSPRR